MPSGSTPLGHDIHRVLIMDRSKSEEPRIVRLASEYDHAWYEPEDLMLKFPWTFPQCAWHPNMTRPFLGHRRMHSRRAQSEPPVVVTRERRFDFCNKMQAYASKLHDHQDHVLRVCLDAWYDALP